MADSDPIAGPDEVSKPSARADAGDNSTRPWIIPVATVLVLATAFCVYYFVYVGARREYLVNRNFRALAALGDQLQRVLTTHGSILEYYSDLADARRQAKHDRSRQDLTKYLLVRPEDVQRGEAAKEQESRRDYVRFLAPTLDLMDEPPKKSSTAKPRPRLDVQRRDGRWQIVLSAMQHDIATGSVLGVLEIGDLLKAPVESLPFDDILLARENGSIVYQEKKAGPQFTTLSALLAARVGNTKSSGSAPAADSEVSPSDPTDGGEAGSTPATKLPPNAWRGGAIHLTDVLLAGTKYKLFLQPVLIDSFTDDPMHAEPAREWVICGLRTSSALEWEALSISYTFIIGFTALFFAICMGGPVLKVIFINNRERFRLRELAFLSLFFILLGAVFTLAILQSVEFRLSDATEVQLRNVGSALADNIHLDLRRMRNQLVSWCSKDTLAHDLKSAESDEVIRNTPGEGTSKKIEPTPPADEYHFVNNAFWTDDDGHQIIKWSTGAYVTPMIDLSHEPIYTSPRRTYLDGTGPAFHFDSILPPNKLEYLAALAIDTLDCNPGLKNLKIRGDVTAGAAFVTAQPFSLIDPILPPGYGFALVDESGRVLFHSDKTKNGRENFREESEWSKELYAGIFGHSSGRSLRISYLGKDYRAAVIPIPGVTQAPWSLIVYSDLSAERTLALQTMTMASTVILLILAGPAMVLLIWSLVKRPRFAPEWIWPDPHRMGTYWYQICLYLLLIAVFLVLGFRGPTEQILIASAAVPYCGLLLTLWCFRRYPSGKVPWRLKPSGGGDAAPLALTAFGATAFVLILWLHWDHLKALIILPVVVAIAIIPLLNKPRQYVTAILRHRRRVAAASLKASPRRPVPLTHVHYYAASMMLLLLLLGVLMPMALFHACLAVERRLDVKRAQLELASAVTERRASLQEKCDSGELGESACTELWKRGSTVWREIVLNPSVLSDGQPAINQHLEPAGAELYEPWFRSLVYQLHHDYNSTAAETLGVISDRIPPQPGNAPDWFWENDSSSVTLHWHGIRPTGDEKTEKEQDVLIRSQLPHAGRRDVLGGIAIALTVMFVLGGILWMLIRKVFLVHLAPLKMTGLRELAEAIRLGRNVLALVPPVPSTMDFEIESAARPIDLTTIAVVPGWAETATLDPPPPSGVTVIRDFEYTSELATAEQKTAFVERLIDRENRQVAAIMRVPASSQDYRRLFPQLTVVDLREEPLFWLREYDGPARDLIWEECRPLSALWPLGAQLAKDIRSEPAFSDDTVPSEILERADPYYRMMWKECSNDQRFVLTQLAEDGLLNPMNGRSIRQLIRRGLIVQDPEFRIMNESFRRFLRSAVTDSMKREWLRDSRRSGWGRVHSAFFTTMIVLGIFLLTTQNALWQSSAAYVTTAFGALGTLAKLFNTYRGSFTGEKAN